MANVLEVMQHYGSGDILSFSVRNPHTKLWQFHTLLIPTFVDLMDANLCAQLIIIADLDEKNLLYL